MTCKPLTWRPVEPRRADVWTCGQGDLAPRWNYSIGHLLLVLKLPFAQATELFALANWLHNVCLWEKWAPEGRKDLSLGIETFLLKLDLCIYVNVYFMGIFKHYLILWIHIESTKFWKVNELRAFHMPRPILRYPWRVWNDSPGEDSSRYVAGSEGSLSETRESSRTGARWS